MMGEISGMTQNWREAPHDLSKGLVMISYDDS